MGKMLRHRELFSKFGCSSATGYRIMRDPTFPKSIKISASIRVHDEEEVEAWLQSKKGLPVTPAIAPEIKRGRKRKAGGIATC